MNPSVRNESIRASAGSGKTWQLTNRYIALMAMQLKAEMPVTPERIIALTFTRKAAGEFFDSILEKLAKAATDPQEAAQLSSDKSDPLSSVLAQLNQKDFETLLRIFVSKMPRLFLGTLDSFFSQILRTFASEYGLTGDFEVIDDHLRANAREQVCRYVFERQTHPGKQSGQREFFEAFRQATFGKEEIKVQRELDLFLGDLHGVLLRAPEEWKWGQIDTIWHTPHSFPWQGENDINIPHLLAKLIPLLESENSEKGYSEKYWAEFQEQAPDYQPGMGFPKRIDYMIGHILSHWPDILRGNATLRLNRKNNVLNTPACALVEQIAKYYVRNEIQVKLQRTQGTYSLLSRFESIYGERIRRRGKLTFQDIELLLSGSAFSESPSLTQQLANEDNRLQIDYRLDARYDHWMVDEFQDTSYPQWKAISNLIDEVIQDSSETRSFFQVGDTKQAIYSWRGGDTRLFDDISNFYNAEDQRIIPRELNVSYRSGEAVIDLVNRVFGDSQLLEDMQLPAPTRERWKWAKHAVADRNKGMVGYSAVYRVVNEDGTNPQQDGRFQMVVSLLEEIQPVDRGIDCAILVQGNREGNQLVNFIRANSSIPVMSESEVSIATDNAINRTIISYLQCITHPCDQFAWQHLRMTPFLHYIEENDLSPGKLARDGVKHIFDYGFEDTIRSFLKKMEAADGKPLDDFNLSRAEDLALAARVFDERGSRDIDDFLRYAREHKVREPNTKSAVQVMTIHKSKGLTFDMVILPELGGKGLTKLPRDLGVSENQQREIEWVLDMPQRVLAEADPVLGVNLLRRQDEAAYENLCKLYVALTRAKYANYLILEPVGKYSKSYNFPKLLESALCSNEPESGRLGQQHFELLFESNTGKTSNANWYQVLSEEKQKKRQRTGEPEDASKFVPLVPATRKRKRVSRRTPSGSEIATVTGAQIFSRRGKQARELGNLIHALFEEIEWLPQDQSPSTALADLEADWLKMKEYTSELGKQSIKQVIECLGQPEIFQLFRKPSKKADCWLEQRFEILLEDEWLSGTFDRVVVDGSAATILDFKTDQIENDEELAKAIEKYRPQQETYREVLAKMLRIKTSDIQLQLLFTRLPKAVTLDLASN